MEHSFSCRFNGKFLGVTEHLTTFQMFRSPILPERVLQTESRVNVRFL